MPTEPPRFGPFVVAFSRDGLGVPGHLALLNLARDRRADTQTVIDRIAHALADAAADRFVAALLAEVNWRPHLVGAIAFLLDRGARLDPALLWQAVDRGSWVTPQLVVTARLTDPDFVHRASARLDARCPVQPTPGLPATPHGGHSGKLAASLLALVPEFPALAPAERRWRADSELVALLERDAGWDQSDRITTGWSSRIRECLAERGVPLARG
ncbi:MAG: hypothetical protein U0168_12785 [Nannocystaceae bacterium]